MPAAHPQAGAGAQLAQLCRIAYSLGKAIAATFLAKSKKLPKSHSIFLRGKINACCLLAVNLNGQNWFGDFFVSAKSLLEAQRGPKGLESVTGQQFLNCTPLIGLLNLEVEFFIAGFLLRA